MKIGILMVCAVLLLGCSNSMEKKLVKKGDKFITTKQIDTHALATWGAGTSSFPCKLPKGTIIIAEYDQGDGAKGFGALPENYNEIEKQIPEANRKQKYCGYYLVFLQTDIGDSLQPTK